MKKIITAAAAIIAFAAIAFYSYSVRDTEIFSRKLPLDTKSIVFSGDEITNLEDLKSELHKFKDLRYVDLGTFKVFADETEELEREFTGVDLRYDTYVKIYGKDVNIKESRLDFSDITVISSDDLLKGLAELDSPASVSLGKNALPSVQVEELKTTYPDIDFDIISIYDIYGKSIRSDTETIDLNGFEADTSLSEKLKLFPNLKAVDLHGTSFDYTEQLTLINEFPNVEFKWNVEFGDMTFDSSEETVDLTDCWWIGTDLVREIIPLFPNLKTLDMSNCGASNEQLAELREDYPDIKVIWRLYLGQWSLKTDAVAFSVLIVNYKHRRMTSDDIQVLKYCTDLRALDLGHQAITDISVIGDYLTELRVLILADNDVYDLTPLSKLKHLHYLELFVNDIVDLSPLAGLREMVDLNICYNLAVNDITPLLEMPMLERLWLEYTAVSARDVQLLRDTYPNAKIVNIGSGSVDQGWRVHERYYAMIDMYHNNYLSDLFSMYDGE